MDKLFPSFFDDLPVMVHSIDKDWRLVYVNRLWLETMGYEKEEVLGRFSSEFFTEESAQFARDIVLPLYEEQGSVREVPYEMKTKSGKSIYCFLSANSMFDENGEFVRSLAIITNISSLLNQNKLQPGSTNNWTVDPSQYNRKLVELRKSKRYSQEKMARVLDISTRTYQRIEQGIGPVTVGHISVLSHHFNFSPSLFFLRSSLFDDQVETYVLVVDDDPTLIEFMINNLEELNFKTYSATSGEEAIEILRHNPVDIIITDIRMPGISGFELIRQARLMELEKTPEIYICSGMSFEEITEKIDFDLDKFLEKPLRFEKLKSALLK